MTATKRLPENYVHFRTLDLTKNKAVMILLNLAGLILFFLFGWFFLWLAMLMRSGQAPLQFNFPLLPWLLALLATYAGVLILHELVHGLFFWLITRERPYFGLKQLYAYAAAPDWYIPRNPYLLVGLAPLILITFLGIILIPFVSQFGLILLLFAMTANAAGAIGDIFVVGWLVNLPSGILVRDDGDTFAVYKVESP